MVDNDTPDCGVQACSNSLKQEETCGWFTYHDSCQDGYLNYPFQIAST